MSQSIIMKTLPLDKETTERIKLNPGVPIPLVPCEKCGLWYHHGYEHKCEIKDIDLPLQCTRCCKRFHPDDTLDAYDKLGYMLTVNRFNGHDFNQKHAYMEELCGECTFALNEFLYDFKKGN